MEENFDLSRLKEYTVEAGRPDTITREKLKVLKKYNITRISINPQTLNDEVLRGIGRKHTAQEIIDCFYMAREEGFDDINMDLIAGLPGDTVEGFCDTIDRIIALDPGKYHSTYLIHQAKRKIWCKLGRTQKSAGTGLQGWSDGLLCTKSSDAGRMDAVLSV